MITNARLAAEALDFCVMKDCAARCEGEELPEGWALFSIMRRPSDGQNLQQLHAARCPEHAEELLQRLKPIGRTGTMVVTLPETPQSGAGAPRSQKGDLHGRARLRA